MVLSAITNAELAQALSRSDSAAPRHDVHNREVESIQKHVEWITRNSLNTTKWFRFHENENEVSGFVYFTSIDHQNKTAIWGSIATPEASPRAELQMRVDSLEMAFK